MCSSNEVDNFSEQAKRTGWLMMEGASASGRAVRWKDEVKMENLDQFVMETAPQVFSLRTYRYSHVFFSF